MGHLVCSHRRPLCFLCPPASRRALLSHGFCSCTSRPASSAASAGVLQLLAVPGHCSWPVVRERARVVQVPFWVLWGNGGTGTGFLAFLPLSLKLRPWAVLHDSHSTTEHSSCVQSVQMHTRFQRKMDVK